MRYLVLIIALLVGCATPQRQYAHKTDLDLKVRRMQLIEFLNGYNHTLRVGHDDFRGHWHDAREEKTAEKDDIETELLRRWKAGDQDAYLPLFDPSKVTQ